MRSRDTQQPGLFSYVSVEDRVPASHPIRRLRVLVDALLLELDGELAKRYSSTGRPSIPPERLLRACLLQVVYSVRSERLLMEQLNYNLLFRWFVGLNVDDPVWDHSTFSFNRERLFDEHIAQRFFENTVLLARLQDLEGYDTREFVASLLTRGIAPHIARHTTRRRSAVDGRTARGKGYATKEGKSSLSLYCMRNATLPPVLSIPVLFGSSA